MSNKIKVIDNVRVIKLSVGEIDKSGVSIENMKSGSYMVSAGYDSMIFTKEQIESLVNELWPEMQKMQNDV